MSSPPPFPPPGFDELSREEQLDYIEGLLNYVTTGARYVEIPDGVPAAPLPIAAPGNPRVTILATGSSPAHSTGAGLDEQRRGERGGTGASLAEGALNDPALQEHGRGERAGN